MTTTNRYEEIVERNTVRRARDVVFAMVLAAVTAFSLTSIRAAADTVRNAPAATIAPTTAAPIGQMAAGDCEVEPSC